MADLAKINDIDAEALGKDAALSLKLLYMSFIQGGKITNAVDGTRQQGQIPEQLTAIASTTFGVTAPSTNMNSIVINVLTNNAFKSAYPDALFAATTPLDGFIHKRTGDVQTYVVVQSEADIPNSSFNASDVNVYAWLNSQSSATFKTLAASLRDMKVAYQLLDDSIYTSMMSLADPTKLSIFPRVSDNKVYDVILDASFKPKVINDSTMYGGASQELAFEDVNSFSYFARTLDPITQDIFAIRRVILATYLMAQARLFSRMYYSLRYPSGPSGSAIAAAGNTLTAGKLAHYFYNRLVDLNRSYESSRLNMSGNETSSNETITKAIQDNVDIYTDNTQALSKINDDIAYKRRSLASEIARVKSESKDASFSKRLVIASIVLASTLMLVLFAVFIMPVDVMIRVKVAAIVVAVALVVVAVLIFLQKRNLHEGFAGRVTTGGLNVSFGTELQVEAADIDKLMKMIDVVFTEELRNYYRYTVELTLLLKNNRLYNELNYNTSKERSWFENSQYQINKAVVDAKTAQRLYDRKTKISTALLRFVLQVLVIVAFVVLGVAAVQDAVPILVNVIYVIGGILFVLAVFMMFGNILRRTYIDADRLYWGTPSAVYDL